jgi:hypothetical protein
LGTGVNGMATEEADWRIVAIVGVIEMDELNGRKLDGIAGALDWQARQC